MDRDPSNPESRPSQLRRRVRRRWPRWTTWGMLFLVVLISLRLGSRRPSAVVPLPPAHAAVEVLRVIDGDTLLLASGHRVRLIGVDTPETKHPDKPPEPWGSEAAAYTRQRIEGRQVILTYDRERLDVYGRVLAFVEVDGQLLNEELIRGGFSRAVTSFPYRSDLQRRFRQAEEQARLAGRGIWAIPAGTATATLVN